jgi:hypothetical protein
LSDTGHGGLGPLSALCDKEKRFVTFARFVAVEGSESARKALLIATSCHDGCKKDHDKNTGLV